MRICWVCRWTQIHRDLDRNDGQYPDQHEGKKGIDDHLAGVERDRWQLGAHRVFLDWACRACFAKEKDVRSDEANQQGRQHEYMQHIKAGQC